MTERTVPRASVLVGAIVSVVLHARGRVRQLVERHERRRDDTVEQRQRRRGHTDPRRQHGHGGDRRDERVEPRARAMGRRRQLRRLHVSSSHCRCTTRKATVPWLADSVTPDSDAFDVWTVKVHPGITFHDGTELGAADVKASLDLAINEGLAGVASSRTTTARTWSISTPPRST